MSNGQTIFCFVLFTWSCETLTVPETWLMTKAIEKIDLNLYCYDGFLYIAKVLKI